MYGDMRRYASLERRYWHGLGGLGVALGCFGGVFWRCAIVNDVVGCDGVGEAGPKGGSKGHLQNPCKDRTEKKSKEEKIKVTNCASRYA